MAGPPMARPPVMAPPVMSGPPAMRPPVIAPPVSAPPVARINPNAGGANRQGPLNANVNATTNANAAARLGSGSTQSGSMMGGANPNAGGANRQGPANANVNATTNANAAARLGSGSTQSGSDVGMTSDRRMGPSRASDQGVANSNENARLRAGGTETERGGRDRTELNRTLREGLQIRDAAGALAGTVTGLVRDADGDITGVTLRLADGTTRTVSAGDVVITDGAATLNLSQLGSPPAGTEALVSRLQQGAQVFDPSGQLLGRIERVVTSGGNPTSVVVQVRNGTRRFLRTVPIDSVTLGSTGQLVVRVGG
jgi:hypothetical protein